MQVVFFRHGPAEPRNEWKGDDAERPLSRDGRQLVAEVAAAMLRSGLKPELILSSPLVRTQQSAAILAGCLGVQDQVVIDRRLGPGFGPEQLQKILRDYGKYTLLLLVSQEPDLSHTIGKLVGRSRLVIKKAGVVQVEIPDSKTLKGQLLGLLSPTFFADPPRSP